jgi:hypothetical protein
MVHDVDRSAAFLEGKPGSENFLKRRGTCGKAF